MPCTTEAATADVELAAREVVEEEDRLGAEHEDVVHAHRDEVDADGVVLLQAEGELQLRAYAVGARDHHRLAVLLRHFDQRAESADAAEDLGAHRAFREGLDALDEGVARIDVHAGVAIGEGRGRAQGAKSACFRGEILADFPSGRPFHL
jgi:hypothetical protein